MKDLIENITDRIEYLEKIVKGAQKRKLEKPHATLLIKPKGDREYYYKRNHDDNSVSYIRKRDVKEAQRIAQFTYENRYVKEAEHEITVLKKTRDILLMSSKAYDKVYNRYRRLVKPITYSKESEALKWQRQKFEPCPYPFTNSFTTDRGEIVRSKSELIIANKLYKRGVLYRYEAPLKIGDKIIWPDFTIYDIKTGRIIIWEHFGMVDNLEYISTNVKKYDWYIEHDFVLGINLFISHESESRPLMIKEIDNIIDAILG